MSLSDPQLLALQVEALFTHDPDGRIRSVNEPDGDPAPRFFLGRTREGDVWRIRHDLPQEVVTRLEGLVAAEPMQEDLRAEPRAMDAMLAVLGGDRAKQSVDAGPAYRFPDDLPAPIPATFLTRSDIPLLARMVANLEDVAREFEERQPRAAVVEDGVVVSICYSARRTQHAAEAGVETLEEYRGRGYGKAVVAAWARAIRATGRIPLYSTSWDNLASQAVARKLRLIQYATDLSVA